MTKVYTIHDPLYYPTPYKGSDYLPIHGQSLQLSDSDKAKLLSASSTPIQQYDPTLLERDIKQQLQKHFFSRQELIDKVREFGSQRGFNICIPRGDIVLQDGTL